MNKKNRFSMLEIDNDQQKDNGETSNIKKNNSAVELSKPIQQLKVIVKNEEFEKNLKLHNLKAREKEITQEKLVIESRIFRIRRDAWIKIILGIYILILVAKKYLWGEKSIKNLGNNQGELVITQTTLSTNDKFLVVLILLFIYFTFFKKNQKDKK